MVSLDRMEVGQQGTVGALQEIKQKYGFPTHAIVSMKEVTEYLYNRPVDGRVVIDDKLKAALDKYYDEYGVK
jgi:orotate phosphoribosyltransferase